MSLFVDEKEKKKKNEKERSLTIGRKFIYIQLKDISGRDLCIIIANTNNHLTKQVNEQF